MSPSPSGPGIVVIDKPAGMTSHDVVGRCRRIFSTRRVGHAGTLDPMATGVLVIGIDRATKILGLLTATSKSYAATIRLGQTTSTEDAEGEVLQSVSAEHLTDRGDRRRGRRRCAATSSRCRRRSAPSRWTAGAPISWSARAGPSHSRPGGCASTGSRCSTLRSDGQFVDVDVEVDCSSGTYIRALARDVGVALGVGGHLTALRRTRVGRFALEQARSLDELAERPGLSLTLDEACLLMFPRRDLTAEEAEATANGRPLSPAGIDGVYAACDADGRVIALLRDEGSRTKSVVVIRPATLEE